MALKAHLNYTRKPKDLLTIFEKSFSSHRLASLKPRLHEKIMIYFEQICLKNC